MSPMPSLDATAPPAMPSIPVSAPVAAERAICRGSSSFVGLSCRTASAVAPAATTPSPAPAASVPSVTPIAVDAAFTALGAYLSSPLATPAPPIMDGADSSAESTMVEGFCTIAATVGINPLA